MDSERILKRSIPVTVEAVVCQNGCCWHVDYALQPEWMLDKGLEALDHAQLLVSDLSTTTSLN